MPDDPEAEEYVEAYADYSHEAEPNYSRIDQGMWGPTTGAGLICEHCNGDGNLIEEPPGGDQGGGGIVADRLDDGGFGGGRGGESMEAEFNVLRDKYIMMGFPVVPDSVNEEQDPQDVLGDNLNETTPQWAPDIELQTWRFSRWANNYEYDPIPGGIYRGYLRYEQDEPSYNGVNYGDIDDPPLPVPGRGYWFVFNLGARFETSIWVDAPRQMPSLEDRILPLESQLEGDVNPALNMMANPWPFPIDWADVRFSTDQENWFSAADLPEIDDYAYTWNHASEFYVPKNRRLEVWEGFWVVVNTTDPMWIKFPPIIADNDVPTLETDELDEVLDWSLLLTARRVDRLQVDYQNWIGVGDELSDQRDELDALQLAPQAREAIFLRSRTLDPENGFPTDRMTYDFRANDMIPGEPKAWLMEVLFYVDDPAQPNAYPVDVSIRWPNITSVPENIQLAVHEFVFPFDPDPEHVLIEDLRQQDEFILSVDGNIGGYPNYKIGRFWISATDMAGVLDAPEISSLLPHETRLGTISPNPFNSTTNIRFEVANNSRVTVRIFNLLGEQVASITDNQYQPGYHQVAWNAGDLASGVYFVRFDAPGIRMQMSKIVLVR